MEFARPTQVNILEDETLILLLKEVIIMFDNFHAIRLKCMDFTIHGSRGRLHGLLHLDFDAGAHGNGRVHGKWYEV